MIPYDIVLMDIELPTKSGIVLSKEILETHPATQIIFITQYRETTTIYCTSSVYHTSEKLTDLLDRLDPNFTCCHRSYLINLNQIIDFENHLVTLAGKYQIPISQKRAVEVKRKFLEMFMK